MTKSTWSYSRSSRRYHAADGRFLSHAQMVGLRDRWVDSQKLQAADLTERLTDGTLTVAQWELETRQRLKTAHLDSMILGRGGRAMMTPADYGRLGALLKDQYAWLHGFAGEVAEGNLSAARIAQRTGMYFDAAVQSYERGRAAAFGVDLPGYPADGGTPCGPRCRCHWSMVETEDGIEATWKLDPQAEHCEGCVDRATEWDPLIIEKGGEGIVEGGE